MTGDCQFTLTSGGVTNLALTNGNVPGGNPTQPLSDVTAVKSPTTPNNELCNFPYAYTPGNWQMWFCRRYSLTNYSCPTDSGLGGCVMGKFAGIRASATTGAYDQTYVTDVKQSSSAIQCLDFYYYIPGTLENARMQVGWKADADTQQIVELTAHSENRWQNSLNNFTAPSLSSYQLTFRMMRDTGSFSFTFGLDEIKIYDQPCDSTQTTTTTTESTSMIHTSTTTPVLPDTTTPTLTITTTRSPETLTTESTTTTTELLETTATISTTTTTLSPEMATTESTTTTTELVETTSTTSTTITTESPETPTTESTTTTTTIELPETPSTELATTTTKLLETSTTTSTTATTQSPEMATIESTTTTESPKTIITSVTTTIT
ncbi:unnamed protein product, partial [Rotaria sordida]